LARVNTIVFRDVDDTVKQERTRQKEPKKAFRYTLKAHSGLYKNGYECPHVRKKER